jgi:tetratricopeptide (TPR) repeat protein
MNHPRARSSADIVCRESGRPVKKARVARSEDDECLNAEDLNLKGISNMLSGHDAEAERCFSQALCQLDESLPYRDRSHLSLSRSKSFDLTPSPVPSSDDYADVNPIAVASQAPRSDDEEKGGVKAQRSPTLLYIYQRQEYDEGMYVYDEALPLDDGCSVEAVRSATLLYNVAQTHVRRGTYFEAKKWFEMALIRLKLADATRLEYTSSVKMVWIYHNLGHCLYRLGKNDDASRCYKKARVIIEGLVLDSFHLAAVNVACGVLLFHSNASDLDQALEHFTGALPAYRAKYGESKEVATILNNVGRVHYLKANYDDALVAYEEALTIRRKTLGKTSIDVAATVCNTGQTHHQKGNLEQAMEYYKEFLGLAKSRLGTNHRDVAIIYKCMADIFHERGDKIQAKEMYEKSLAVGKQALGPYHPELTSTLNKLGNLHYEMQDLDTALQYYTEGLHVERIILEPCHPHLLVTLANIAQIHRHRGNFAAALLKYAEIHSLQIKSLGPNSLEVAETLSSMGLMEYQLKAFSAAFALYQAALRIQRDHYGTDDHIDIASTLNSIGLILFNQGVYELAKSCFTDSLRIRTKLLGPDHREVAILWYNIATIYLESGEDDVALQLYKETLRVERKALGETHHDVILTLQHLGLVYQERGELDEALKYFNDALEIERTKGGKYNVSVGKLLNLIGNIHLRRANVDEMMKCYTEASRLYRDGGLVNESLVIAGYNFYGLSKLHPPTAATA